MFELSPEDWQVVTEDDILPKRFYYIDSDVYFSGSRRQPILGQIEQGSPVFWQIDKISAYLPVMLSNLIFWQELGGGIGIINWRIDEDRNITFWREDPSSEDNIILNNSNMGVLDAFNVWHPQYQKKTYLDILIDTAFKSITKTTKHCLITMIMSANDSGKVFELSNSQIRELTGYSKETVITHLKKLKKLKLIKELGENRRKNVKRVNGVYQEDIPKYYQIKFGYEMKEFDSINLDQRRRLK